MWPFERRRDVLRIGRERVERWRPSEQGLVLQDQRAIEDGEGMRPEALGAALQSLLSASVGAPLDVVLESAWLPLMLLAVGEQPQSAAKLQALLRHRLTELYGKNQGPMQGPIQGSMDDWSLQLDYRPGDSQALGFGLAPDVRRVIVDTAGATGHKLASMQPAFQWGAQQLGRRLGRREGRRDERGGGRHESWWLWLEQDRGVLARLEQGRVVSLNAATPLPQDEAFSNRLAGIEARRHGLSDPEVCVVTAGWSAPWESVAA